MGDIAPVDGCVKRAWRAYVGASAWPRPTLSTYLKFYEWTRNARWLAARRVCGIASLVTLFLSKRLVDEWSNGDHFYLQVASVVAAFSLVLGVIPGDRFVNGSHGELDAMRMPCGFINAWRSASGRTVLGKETSPGRVVAYSALFGVVTFGTLWGPLAWSQHVSMASIQISMYIDAKAEGSEEESLASNDEYSQLEELKKSAKNEISWVLATVPLLALTALVSRLSNRELESRDDTSKMRYRVVYLPRP